MAKLDLNKIPAVPESPEERHELFLKNDEMNSSLASRNHDIISSVSAVKVPLGTPPPDNESSASLLKDSGDSEVLRKSSKQNRQELLLKQKLAVISNTNAKDWFIVSRARHGMEQVFRQLKKHYGDGSIITQPFTCVTAINPIIVAGFTPIYCDITKDTFSITADNLGKLLDDVTRAVVVQHSFGIPADMVGIKQQLQTNSNVLIVEDSAHCLGFIARNNGKPLADISVHSFGSEKFLKTNFGGALWVNPAMNDKTLRDNLVQKLTNLPKATALISLRVWLYPRFNGVLNRLPKALSNTCRKILLASGLLRSPIVPKEQRGVNFEPCQRPSDGQLKIIDKAISNYSENVSHRLGLVKLYKDILTNKTVNLEVPNTVQILETPLVRFPLLAKSADKADQIFNELRQKGMNVGKWYRPLFFPGVKDYSAYNYRVGSCPVAEDVSARIINLPTDLNTTPEVAKEIANALIN